MTHVRTASLAVPTGKGHRHRRSAAISLDWRHIQLPAIEPQVPVAQPPASCSPTLTFASTLSDSSMDEQADTRFKHASPRTPPKKTTGGRQKRVSFKVEVQHIPDAEESGDTWMRPEDYSWPTPAADSKTVLLDAIEPSIDLAPAMPTQVPGSPVLMHRKKRASFLQTTKNYCLTRRPSKKRPVSPAPVCFEVPIPAPKSSMIDLDLALEPKASLRHKKSGSLGTFSALPASPTKPKTWHKRSDSAPANLVFSFSPRPSSPDSRKRKMSSIQEQPLLRPQQLQEGITLDDSTLTSETRFTGLTQVMADELILGEPGEMVATTQDGVDLSAAVIALRGHRVKDSVCMKKGWKGVLHRLLH